MTAIIKMIKCSLLCFLLSLFFIKIILLSPMLILTTSNQKKKKNSFGTKRIS